MGLIHSIYRFFLIIAFFFVIRMLCSLWICYFCLMRTFIRSVVGKYILRSKFVYLLVQYSPNIFLSEKLLNSILVIDNKKCICYDNMNIWVRNLVVYVILVRNHVWFSIHRQWVNSREHILYSTRRSYYNKSGISNSINIRLFF